MALEQFANNAQSTLASGINNSVTSLTVADGSSFPSSGDFRLRIDNELLLCTARSGAVMTVTRGIEGTSGATHDANAAVVLIGTAEAIQQLAGVFHQTGAFASAPAASRAGLLYLPNDGVQVLRDSGSAQVPWGPMFPLTQPVDGDFSWINQGTSTVDAAKGGIYLEGDAQATSNWRARVKSAPSTPYTIDIGFIPLIGSSNFSYAGAVFRDSSTGELVTFVYSSQLATLELFKYNSPTSFNSAYTINEPRVSGGPLIFVRLADDGVDRIVSASADGQHWVEIHSVTRTDFLTADQVGFAVNDSANTYRPGMLLASWKEG